MKKMKDKSKRALLIARAKRTALGRFLCRLAGDNAGAVMMEYVVLGVLVVAAVVAAAIFFGDTIRDNFLIMVYTIQGDITKANEIKNQRKNQSSGAEEKARSDSHTLSGGQMDNN